MNPEGVEGMAAKAFVDARSLRVLASRDPDSRWASTWWYGSQSGARRMRWQRCPAPAKRTGGVAQATLMCQGRHEKRIFGGITTFTHVSIVCGLNNANGTD
ncbi:hypothetical protein SVAN01_09731 [Stagonosporopsis vannaccii]|nr:hypothetical protein SVAN01_09731 [Stagonosporopsis vannaccii]